MADVAFDEVAPAVPVPLHAARATPDIAAAPPPMNARRSMFCLPLALGERDGSPDPNVPAGVSPLCHRRTGTSTCPPREHSVT